jgi:hypothetical protein
MKLGKKLNLKNIQKQLQKQLKGKAPGLANQALDKIKLPGAKFKSSDAMNKFNRLRGIVKPNIQPKPAPGMQANPGGMQPKPAMQPAPGVGMNAAKPPGSTLEQQAMPDPATKPPLSAGTLDAIKSSLPSAEQQRNLNSPAPAAGQQAQPQTIGPAQQEQQMKDQLMPQASGAPQNQAAGQEAPAADNSGIDQQIAALQKQIADLQAKKGGGQ